MPPGHPRAAAGDGGGAAVPEDRGRGLTGRNTALPWEPATTLFDLHPKELETYLHTKVHAYAYSSFAHDGGDSEASKESTSKRVDPGPCRQRKTVRLPHKAIRREEAGREHG